MNDPVPQKPTYRVVQWATGNIGTRALRAVIEHPRLDLVGVRVTNPEKVGQDAGALCGLGPTGITATDDLAVVVALRPDCVLYMQQGYDVECSAPSSGRGSTSWPHRWVPPSGQHGPGGARAVETACASGDTSIHCTGVSPGFISEAVPVVLTSLQRRLDRLHIAEFADLSSRNSPVLLFDLMGYGQDPSTFDPMRWAHGAEAFGPSLRLIGEALGMPLDSVESSGEVATANSDIEIAAGTIPAGTVAGQRMNVVGKHQGVELISFSATWYCTTEIDAAWDLRPGGWRVTVEGDCPLDMDLRLAVPLELMAESTPGYTANRAVNAVSVVCEAAPGIRTTVDLPQIVADLGLE